MKISSKTEEIMKIELEYFLNKKNIKLNYFCDINNIKNYDELVAYCTAKRFIPVGEDFYNNHFPKKEIEKKDETKKKDTKSRSKTSKTNTTRRPRKTPAKKSVRNGD